MNAENYFNIDISLLLIELGLDSLPEEDKSQIAAMLKETIIAKIKVYLTENLETADLEFLDANADNTEVIQKFLIETKGIDFNQLLIAIGQDSREELLKDVEYIRGMIDAKNDQASA